MKALSVKQPFASMIAVGEKTVECRTWPTQYRGELLICSSKGDGYIDYTDMGLDEDPILPGGMALCMAKLVDCTRMIKADLDYAMLPEEWEKDALKGFAWHLRLLYQIVPVPVKGKLGIYNLDIDIQKLPDKYLDHLVYMDYQKYGKFRLPEWESKKGIHFTIPS